MRAQEILAVIIPQVTETDADCQQALASAKDLERTALINHIEIIKIQQPDASPPEIYNAGIDRARELDATWILFLKANEMVEPNALTFLGPVMDSYDGLWGGIHLITPEGTREIAKLSQMSSSDIVRNYHTALHWWIGKSHFIRTETASELRFDAQKGGAWYGDYLTRLWQSKKSLKSAQPLTAIAGELPILSQDDRDFMLVKLETEPAFMSFYHHNHEIHLPYTGRNPTLERVQLRGLFYEQSDLHVLKDHIHPGAICVDVGANTGNHTVFFAKVLGAKTVIPVEPNPATIPVLKRTIDKNRLSNVDTSKLGIGVGRASGRFDIETGRRGYLGTARLNPNIDGSIPVEPLDALLTEPVDLLKIDVEMMEIDVLEGARHLIENNQPVLLIEVQDENINALLVILDNLRYRIENVFPDQGYANYLALPGMKA